jgi:hypothetical protein
VVVVSAPTPFAPFVALRPVSRLSGLVEVLFGVVLAFTPAVVPASVGVPFAAVISPDAEEVVTPVAAADVDGAVLTVVGVHGMARRLTLSVAVCCAPALTAIVVPNSIAMPAIRHRTICSVRCFTFDMSSS